MTILNYLIQSGHCLLCLDGMLDGRSVRSRQKGLKFYLKPAQQRNVRDRHALRSVSLSLGGGAGQISVRKAVIDVLVKAELPTSYVDSIAAAAATVNSAEALPLHDFGFNAYEKVKVDWGLQVSLFFSVHR